MDGNGVGAVLDSLCAVRPALSDIARSAGASACLSKQAIGCGGVGGISHRLPQAVSYDKIDTRYLSIWIACRRRDGESAGDGTRRNGWLDNRPRSPRQRAGRTGNSLFGARRDHDIIKGQLEISPMVVLIIKTVGEVQPQRGKSQRRKLPSRRRKAAVGEVEPSD